MQDLVGYWVNVSLLKRIFHMNTLFTWKRDRCLGKKAHLELKVTSSFILVYLWVSASGIASRCHFTEDKFCLCSTPTEISPQPGHLQKASSDSRIVITESGRREKQECCTEVYSLMWNLIEHDSTEICQCNGDELVFQVHQQLSKRHSTLTSPESALGRHDCS